MSLATLITQFGYPALIIGLFFEGETALVLAAFLAHRGYLNLQVVILLGWMMGFAADQFFFWMGRTRGSRFLETRPGWNAHAEKARARLKRNPHMLFVGIRFLYGLRTVLSFVIGMSGSHAKKFMALDFIGALLWALTYGLAGQLLGRVMAEIFEDVREHEVMIVIGIILFGIGIWLYRSYLDQRQKV